VGEKERQQLASPGSKRSPHKYTGSQVCQLDKHVRTRRIPAYTCTCECVCSDTHRAMSTQPNLRTPASRNTNAKTNANASTSANTNTHTHKQTTTKQRQKLTPHKRRSNDVPLKAKSQSKLQSQEPPGKTFIAYFPAFVRTSFRSFLSTDFTSFTTKIRILL